MNKIFVSLAILSMFVVAPRANAVPASSWRIRKTSLSTREQCVRRAVYTLEQAGLKNIRISELNKMAVHGETEQMNSIVFCENGGALAAIFCAGYNRDESRRSCDYIAASMSQ